MKDVISFVCTEVPFLEDAVISAGSLDWVIFSLKISVMISGRAAPDINNQHPGDIKIPKRQSDSEHKQKHEENFRAWSELTG